MAIETQPDHLQIDCEDDHKDERDALDMCSLTTFLPCKRGLSKYFTGKSQSYSCISDVKRVEDLEKPEYRCAKRRRKYSSNESPFLPPPACRLVLGTLAGLASACRLIQECRFFSAPAEFSNAGHSVM